MYVCGGGLGCHWGPLTSRVTARAGARLSPGYGVSTNYATVTLVGFTPAPSADLYVVAEPGTGPVNSTAGNTPARPTYVQAVRTPFTVPSTGPIVVTLPPLSFSILVLTRA